MTDPKDEQVADYLSLLISDHARRLFDASSIALEYMQSYLNVGRDAKDALFQLLQVDEIQYSNYLQLLKEHVNNASTIRKNRTEITDSGASDQDKIKMLNEQYRKLSAEDELFQELAIRLLNPNIYEYIDGGLMEDIEDRIVSDEMGELFASTNWEDARRRTERRIAEMIYSRLVNADILLSNEFASEGDKLEIFLIWTPDHSTTESYYLHLCAMDVKKMGWKTEISDTFFLIERLDEGESANSSPSNFKAAPGVNLMRSYHSKPQLLNTSGKKIGFLNKIEPSIGLNVSYLDFDITKDFEVGTGISFGLFRNQLFLTYGVNLHQIQNTFSNAHYFGVGFSFAKLSDRVEGKK